jgi:hypothetical protein
VETTIQYGFDPGTRKEFFDEFGRTTGFRYVEPTNYKYRKSISDVHLLSLIVQNRLTSGNSKKDPGTLRLAMDWYGQIADQGAAKELVYAWNKYVQWLNRKERYDDAILFVKYFKTQFGTTQFLRQSVQTLVYNQIVILIEKKRLDAAERLLDETTDALSLGSRRMLAEYLLSKAMKNADRSKNYDHVLALTDRLLTKGYFEERVSLKYSQYFQAKKQYEAARRK